MLFSNFCDVDANSYFSFCDVDAFLYNFCDVDANSYFSFCDVDAFNDVDVVRAC
jgi:hypothetical protein